MRIGTRGSALALAQARLVCGWLGGAEIVVVRTSGDMASLEHRAGSEQRVGHRHDGPRNDGDGVADTRAGGDKSRWVAELEQALLADEIDLAVHSAKDVPGVLAAGLELFGAPVRASAADALIGASSLEGLPQGARVGTSSLRRAAQLRAARWDLDVVGMRGNVDTRLRKLGEGELDAIVLASAGLVRLERELEIGAVLEVERFVPAPGQGALALEGRIGDVASREAVESILDGDATACLSAERAVAAGLDADCDTPLGAYAVPAGDGELRLRAWVGLPDGSEWVLDELVGDFHRPEELGRRVAERLKQTGAGELLARAREMAVEHA